MPIEGGNLESGEALVRLDFDVTLTGAAAREQAIDAGRGGSVRGKCGELVWGANLALLWNCRFWTSSSPFHPHLHPQHSLSKPALGLSLVSCSQAGAISWESRNEPVHFKTPVSQSCRTFGQLLVLLKTNKGCQKPHGRVPWRFTTPSTLIFTNDLTTTLMPHPPSRVLSLIPYELRSLASEKKQAPETRSTWFLCSLYSARWTITTLHLQSQSR